MSAQNFFQHLGNGEKLAPGLPQPLDVPLLWMVLWHPVVQEKTGGPPGSGTTPVRPVWQAKLSMVVFSGCSPCTHQG